MQSMQELYRLQDNRGTQENLDWMQHTSRETKENGVNSLNAFSLEVMCMRHFIVVLYDTMQIQ